MTSQNNHIQDLLDTVDLVLERIDENWSNDLRIAKNLAVNLREELEDLAEGSEE